MSRKDRREAEWRRVLANVQKDLSKDGMGVVQRALLLSYRDLPRALKPCFLLLSVIPYDMEISRKKLVRLWIAEGFVREEGGETLEATAEMYLMELISRSMIQVSIASAGGRLKACRVHNLVHDLAVSLSEKEKFSVICRDQGVNVGARRVSFQASDVSFGNEHKKRRLRSVFMFSSNEPLEFTHNDARKLRLLRVLDLEDAKVTKLPNEIGVLIHLRYLELRGTKLKKIPSLQRLCHLQTLDIRKTRIKELAFQIKCLRNLRHLEMKHGEQSIRVTIGLARLDKLQVLTGLQATTAMVHEIESLKQLKKLALEDLSQEDVKILCSSVSNLKELSYLSIFSRDVNQPLDLSMLKPSPCLQKLHLAGSLQDLPSWFGELHNLTKLRLSFSQLREDPLTVLARLPNLLFLQLNNAYQGTFMRCCNSGFRKLKILVITELEGLERWVVAEGAMPCIQEVWIMSCTRLAMVPAGFRSLVTLHKLTLVGMPSSFVDRLGELGEDLVSVEHIPSIQILPQIG